MIAPRERSEFVGLGALRATRSRVGLTTFATDSTPWSAVPSRNHGVVEVDAQVQRCGRLLAPPTKAVDRCYGSVPVGGR
jgi:hypothetical protein